MKTKLTIASLLSAAFLFGNASAQYAGWTYSDSLFIITTADGANIPASATETGFPLLVRLDKDYFTFSQAKTDGSDIRFSTPSGTALPYQIEEWDATKGTASIWVKIPTITGNARQAIKMYWGNSGAAGESNGAAVFSSSNGFCSVLHLNNSVKDEIGTTNPTNNGTTLSAGVIGGAAHVGSAGKLIDCGSNITGLPSGANPRSTSVWFRADFPGNVLGWGKMWIQGGMTIMALASPPPHVYIMGYFSNVEGKTTVPLGKWVHAEHTYQNGTQRIYINGVLDNTSSDALNTPTSAGFQIGGFSEWGGLTYLGDIDEVRLSTVVRSADWIKMEYENQNPVQSMVGPLVQPGTNFSVPQTHVTVLESKTVTIAANAGGAQKIYWILKGSGAGTVIAVDRFNLSFTAGRVTKDTTITLQFKAVYPTEVKTQDVTLTIKEDQPDPVFTLSAPSTWNGRDPIDVVAQVSNQAAMDSKGVGALTYAWDLTGVAVDKSITPGKLTLKRSQGSGKLTVTLTISNGGTPVTRSAVITVTEPATDSWVVRTPAADEKPENNQFYARDDKNVCTVYYKGTITTSPDSIFLKVYAGTTLSKRLAQKLTGNSYSFEPAITPGLTEYKFEFGSKTGAAETLLNTVTNVLCGDAYIIDGQSNAESYVAHPFTSDYIVSYGSAATSMPLARTKQWGKAVSNDYTGSHPQLLHIGHWGMVLARNLMEKYKIPICVINGANGGTRVDQHVRKDANPADSSTIYGRLLWRVQQAKLTHGIRGVLWHQGENNSGAADPTGDWDYVHYQQYFVQMSSAWKQDFPNILHYYVFQVFPRPCGMGPKDDEVREAHRTLPYLYSNMSVMSTVGVEGSAGTCHFPAAGYVRFAELMGPLVERDNYGLVPATVITAPDIKRAYYTSAAKNEIALVFGQDMAWNAAATVNFFLDTVAGKVTSGSAAGKIVKLTLAAASTAKTVKYVSGASWAGSLTNNLLKGTNGIAALTFCNVPILPDSAMVAAGKQPVWKTHDGVSVTMKNGAVLISFSRLASASAPVTVELVNLRGQTVAGRKIARMEAGNAQMTLPGLRRGVYVLKIKSLGRTELLKKLTVY